MANRYMVRNLMTMEKAPVTLYGKVAIGGTGAPTIDAIKSLGILSIVRSSAGKYVLRLGGPVGNDSYQRLLMGMVNFVVSTTSAVCSTSISVDNSAGTTPSVTIQCVDFAGAAVDPASGETMLIQLTLSNSNS